MQDRKRATVGEVIAPKLPLNVQSCRVTQVFSPRFSVISCKSAPGTYDTGKHWISPWRPVSSALSSEERPFDDPHVDSVIDSLNQTNTLVDLFPEPIQPHPPHPNRRLYSYMLRRFCFRWQKRIVFMGLLLSTQLILLYYAWQDECFWKQRQQLLDLFGQEPLRIAHASAVLINAQADLENYRAVHRTLALCLLCAKLVHTGTHYYNFAQLGRSIITADGITLSAALLHPASLSGHAMLAILIAMCLTSIPKIRRLNYELFAYTHFLYVPFFALLLVHGAFCFLKQDGRPDCSQKGGTFWKYFVPALLWFGAEKIYVAIRSRRSMAVLRVYEHPSRVLEIHLEKPLNFQYRIGHWAYLSFSDIGHWQKHPFTITSAPVEDYICFHIRVVGDWTNKLATKLGCRFDSDTKVYTEENRLSVVSAHVASMPLVMAKVDGPYGSACENVFNYKISVMVGSGIGVTPFASVLKSFWYKLHQSEFSVKEEKIYFIWICRELKAFEWFQDLLETLCDRQLQKFLTIRVYLTGQLSKDQVWNVAVQDGQERDALTGWQTPTYYGRPNFDVLFNQLAKSHANRDVGVFCCGSRSLTKNLRQCCQRHTMTKGLGTRFHFHKEHFD